LKFDCTSRFNSDIQDLIKSRYDSVRADIKDFKDKINSFQEFFDLSTCIIPSNEVRTIKHRIKDSFNRRGSSGGFRVIFIANKKTQTVTFCHVYPKVGSLGKSSASKDEVKEIVNEYISQHKAKSLIPVTF
jgi:mRNA-degrading endonuclease RelE of RelBE toxin-antitoxin system